jgi:hypothetical protein
MEIKPILFIILLIHNSGVEITTNEGASARAVFGGEVASVMVLSPVNKAVMISMETILQFIKT